MIERLQITVTGIVQGVGFRPFVCGLADQLGVRGYVTNVAGDVVMEVEGDGDLLQRFVDLVRTRRPANARIDRMSCAPCDLVHDDAFRIVESRDAADAAAIAPDMATCEDCVEEIFEAGRRSGYAFTSCAACGPRLTIVTAAPYDRERTTMAPFAMCGACEQEYTDPSDRRYHAQPIACPACGPTLAFDGGADDPIARAAAAIRSGKIVAIKGLGGFHLACDATSEATVALLRTRKQRDAKPLAVMVADLAMARDLAELDETEVALLTSPARPIVLARSRGSSALAPSVAGDVADVGLLLPYTPLHHLLVRALPALPIVMTSGNVSDEPIAFRDDDARSRLGAIADHFLTHDREIHTRCEDSVARVLDGGPVILRRARGFAPASIELPFEVAVPTVALGGHLKSVFALGHGTRAFLSPHFGDLDELSAYEAFVAGLEHQQQLHRIAPVRVIHDLHPDYATTRLAEALERRGLERIAVQHHEAHFASALADAELAGRAVGVCFDGAGLGHDGTIWGGEILVGDHREIRRAMWLSPVAQPGGDRAAVEPWRMAVAHLVAAGQPLDIVSARVGALADQLAMHCARAPQTSSVGRLFDAVSALLGLCDRASFEGQGAMRLERLARTERDHGLYEIEIAHDQLQAAPIIRGVCRDLAAGVPHGVIARRFHDSVAAVTTLACERVAAAERVEHVVLTGGVFQNAVLATELPRRLRSVGLVPHLHRRVPPNDGGLSFGQLALAAARVAKGAN